MSEPSRASVALARKWRPRNFATLVGQEHVVRALAHALATRRIHHAYLLTGTRGVGKTTIARILAKALNCEVRGLGHGPDAEPCGSCRACTGIDAQRFPDYIELDAASNRGVEEMTQLLENAVYAPVAGRFKVYVIDEVHMLSAHAFNAMLKTLEEPPGHVVFILATTDPQKVPVTVLSRCLQFNLKNMPPAAIARHLAQVLSAEGIEHEAAALDAIGRAAAGSMRDALSLLDQAIAFGAGRVTQADVALMLGAVDRTYLARILDALLEGDARGAIAVADEMAERGLSFAQALSDLAMLLHRVALAQVGAVADTGIDPQRLEHWARAIEPADLQVYYQIVAHGGRDLPLAPDEQSGFTMTLLRLFAFRPEASGRHSDGAASGRVVAATATATATATGTERPAVGIAAGRPADRPASRIAEPVEAAGARPPGEPPEFRSTVAASGAGPTTAEAASPMAALRAALARPRGASTSIASGASSANPASLSGSTSQSSRPPAAGPAGVTAPATGSSPGDAVASSVVEPVATSVVESVAPSGGGPVAPSELESIASSPAGTASGPSMEPGAARPSQPAATDPIVGFDGDWPTLAARLPVSGLARQFMQQSELLAHADDEFRVRVPIRPLAEGATVSKVRDALSAHLGRPVRLSIEVGAVRGPTAAAEASRQDAERQRQAVEAIREDPFVRTLLTDFGGTIVPGSIRPH